MQRGLPSLFKVAGRWQKDLFMLQPVVICSAFEKRLTSRMLWAVWVVLMTYCSFQSGDCVFILLCNIGTCLSICNSAITWSLRLFLPLLMWSFHVRRFLHYSYLPRALFSLVSIFSCFFSHYMKFHIFLSLHDVRKVIGVISPCHSRKCQCEIKNSSALISTGRIKPELGKLVTCDGNHTVYVHLNQIQPFGTENICSCSFCIL